MVNRADGHACIHRLSALAGMNLCCLTFLSPEILLLFYKMNSTFNVNRYVLSKFDDFSTICSNILNSIFLNT